MVEVKLSGADLVKLSNEKIKALGLPRGKEIVCEWLLAAQEYTARKKGVSFYGFAQKTTSLSRINVEAQARAHQTEKLIRFGYELNNVIGDAEEIVDKTTGQLNAVNYDEQVNHLLLKAQGVDDVSIRFERAATAMLHAAVANHLIAQQSADTLLRKIQETTQHYRQTLQP